MELSKGEKDYLKEFLKIMEEGGLTALVESCHNREFAMYPFIEIIEKVVNE